MKNLCNKTKKKTIEIISCNGTADSKTGTGFRQVPLRYIHYLRQRKLRLDRKKRFKMPKKNSIAQITEKPYCELNLQTKIKSYIQHDLDKEPPLNRKHWCGEETDSIWV